MNEAEIRRNIIDPLLSDLGLEPSEISLERPFTIKLGRYSDEIGGEEKIARPRYDYLVRKNEVNLFIVEAKNEEHKISVDDMEQAICYARLVDPIAPFAVLINGKDGKVYDTLTREEITGRLQESSYVKNGCKIDLNPEIKQQALLALFTLNYDTIVNFCRRQNYDTISRLSESIPESGSVKRYISDIYVKRSKLENTFCKFIKSNSPCFAISGKSGIGKTNAMCELIKSVQNQYLCLFYNGGQMSEKLENEIASDLNWEFSTSKPPERLISQIDDVCKKHDKFLIIFLDAIDEWRLNSSPISISNFVNHIKDKHIKLVVSCKDSKLNEFVLVGGSPSVLWQNLYEVDSQTIEGSSSLTKFQISETEKTTQKSFNLPKFTSDEKQKAIEKYSRYFSLSGFDHTSKTFAACNDPLILRVVSETYRNSTVPPLLNSTQIYEKYLGMVYSKHPLLKAGIRQDLTEVAGAILEQKNDMVYDTSLTLTDNDAFIQIVDYGILDHRPDNLGRYSVAFTFDGLRNYIIAYHVLRLDQLNAHDFKSVLTEHIDSQIGRELFVWFKDFVGDEQRKVLFDQISLHDQNLAHQYLDQFVVKTEGVFPFIKKYLYPSKKLGLLVLYHKEKSSVRLFGFRECEEFDELITWKNITDAEMRDRMFVRELMRQYHVSRLSGLQSDFTNDNLKNFVNKQIFHVIKKILKERRLDEKNNVDISLEKLFAGLHVWGIPLGVSVAFDAKNNLRPISVNDLKQKISYLHPIYTSFTRHAAYHRSFLMLEHSIKNLSKKMSTVTTTALPHMDNPHYPSKYVKPSHEHYTKEGLIVYVREFFKKYVNEYKNIVEANFPTLLDKLPTYQKFPVYVIAQIQKKNSSMYGTSVKYAICINDKDVNEFEIRDNDDAKIHVTHHDTPLARICVRTKNGIKQTNDHNETNIFALFDLTDSEFLNVPLTDWVYNLVEKDLNVVLGSNFENADAWY